MCGLAAIFAPPGSATLAAIGPMTRAVAHRGPDGEGFAFFAAHGATAAAGGALPGVPPQAFLAFGHRRLAIVDLSPAGAQPMPVQEDRYWIIHNGEVYNHVELRAELEAAGVRFRSTSDTEVILRAYERWGRDCLQRLNGMFAFLLFDRQARVLFAARDRFGVKPLYYRIGEGGVLAFASEIKQFAELPDWAAKVNAQRAYDFLAWGLLDHSGETLFADVQQLGDGEDLLLELDRLPPLVAGGRLPSRRWYTPRPGAGEDGFERNAAAFGALLEDSIRLRLRADVPVGSCLSGGLDSSSIVSVMSRLLRAQGATGSQQTFTARAESAALDESAYAAEVAAQAGVRPVYVQPSAADLFENLGSIVRHQDEPFGSTSIYAQWAVFRAASRSGLKVMLDGQGADESLGGYHAYFGPLMAGLLARGSLAGLLAEMRALREQHGYSASWSLQQLANCLLPDAMRQPLRALVGRTHARPAWLDLRRLGADAQDPFLSSGGSRPARVADLSFEQLTRTHLQMLLHWEDRNSMAHSVEARVPFLDYRLVEFALGLPDEHKLYRGATKRVLREAMRGILPERVRARRDKLGFVTAEEAWMRGPEAAKFRAALAAAVEASSGILGPGLLSAFDRMSAGAQAYGPLPWRVISFGAWLNAFRVRIAA